MEKRNHGFKDMTGQRIGFRVVLGLAGKDGAGQATWHCQCDCGDVSVVRGSDLRSGRSLACAKCRTRATHGHARTGARSPTYQTWVAMKNRCLNPATENYSRYGGRGVTVCQRWVESFDAFLADVGERPDGRTLDRIDNFRGYEPGNVRWATRREQRLNTRKRSATA
jgi:hypothetical protein